MMELTYIQDQTYSMFHINFSVIKSTFLLLLNKQTNLFSDDAKKLSHLLGLVWFSAADDKHTSFN